MIYCLEVKLNICHFIGLLDKKSRLKNLTSLTLSGTDISDVGLRYITQFLIQLSSLSISNCWKVTDAGLAQIAMPEAKTAETLTAINLSGCKGITNAGLLHLVKCQKLSKVSCWHSGINGEGMKKFCEESSCSEKLKVFPGAVIDKKQTRR